MDKDKIIAAVTYYLAHTGIHAIYFAAAALLGYVVAHSADAVGAGLDPTLATLVFGFLGTLASRLQAKAGGDSPANPAP